MSLLVKRTPFHGLSSLPSLFDRFFEEPFPFFGLSRPFAWEPEEPERAFQPAVDVRETNTSYEVRAEVPGLKKEDLTIEVLDGVLSISGEKKTEREEEKNGATLRERQYGSFRRGFYVGEEITTEEIQAHYKDGVLTVTVPKREKVRKLVSITEG
ncbi:MAG: Hsp20 family protein [Candidatus Tectomicrobia bacterium]|nr:Hsp20 family protein [Candidatus Tectomicrobia bacterium]